MSNLLNKDSTIFLQGLLEKAIVIATKAHEGQVDKGGSPYILHPLAVMNRVKSLKGKIVAVLHDVREDTPVTENDLRIVGFPEDILAGLDGVTRRKGESRKAFIQRCSENELSIEVKIADLEENMDLTRIPNPTAKDFDRQDMYKKEHQHLKEMFDTEETGSFQPNYAIPPAETLQELMDNRGIVLLDVAEGTGLPLHYLKRIMKAEVELDDFSSEKLGSYLDVPASFLRNLEKHYRATLKRLEREGL